MSRLSSPRPPALESSASSAPASTRSPSATCRRSSTPSCGARIACSIFIASSTSSTSPLRDRAPGDGDQAAHPAGHRRREAADVLGRRRAPGPRAASRTRRRRPRTRPRSDRRRGRSRRGSAGRRRGSRGRPPVPRLGRHVEGHSAAVERGRARSSRTSRARPAMARAASSSCAGPPGGVRGPGIPRGRSRVRAPVPLRPHSARARPRSRPHPAPRRLVERRKPRDQVRRRSGPSRTPPTPRTAASSRAFVSTPRTIQSSSARRARAIAASRVGRGDDELGEQRVVVDARRRSLLDAGVDADPGARGLPVHEDRARARAGTRPGSSA